MPREISRSTAAALVAGLLLLANAWVAHEMVARHRDARAWVEHTYDVLTTLSATRDALESMESGQRGYLLTLRPSYLKPYEATHHDLDVRLAELKRQVSDNAEQTARVERLAKLARAKADELAATVVLARTSGRESALRIVMTDAGDHLMQAFRAEQARIAKAERLLLREREARATRAELRASIAVALVAAVAAICLWIMIVRTIRQMADGRQLLSAAVERRDRAIRERDAADQASRTKSHFLSTTGHDLRQPLGIVAMSLSLIEQQADRPPEPRFLARAKEGVARLSAGLAQLMEVSKIEHGGLVAKARTFPVGELLSDLHQLLLPFAEQKGLKLKVASCDARVFSDYDLLRTCLQNLIGNAIKYTDRGGVLIGCRRRGDLLVIQVIDTGRGIPADQLKIAFDDFMQLQPGSDGVGLGLAIVKRTAGLLGHNLSARSEPGRGSCFSVEVPRVDAALATQARSQVADESADA